MSIAANTNQIYKVLLADGWHEVVDQSFDIDAWEMVEKDGRGKVVVEHYAVNALCSTGFSFTNSEGLIVAGPITSILAVQIDHNWPSARRP